MEVEHDSPGADATRSMRCASKEGAGGRSQTSVSEWELDLETYEIALELDLQIGCANFPPAHLQPFSAPHCLRIQ